MLENWQIGGFGLYVHWPFCQSKCPYCDFNSHVVASIDHDAWLEAYVAEIDRYASETPDRVLGSIYFGGGTPSLMAPATVGAIIERAAQHWTFANDIEITLEANPGSIEAQNFAGYRAVGVNRISIGIQALNDPDLKRLGRLHSVNEAKKALTLAKSLFDRVSFDLIYARQDQTLSAWQAELEEALDYGPDHLSLYQLTVEPGTAFGARFEAGKLRGLPEEDLATDMYFLTQSLCDAAGLPAYEVSNHAKPGQESQHNRIYWRSGDWVGIGPGAHGRLTLGGARFATETALAPARWLSAATSGQGESQRATLPRDEQITEFLLMGLRTTEGLDLHRLDRQLGFTLDSNKINELSDLGLIRVKGHSLLATNKGLPVLNGILRELIPG
ncbi:oxygen-independent coproporphyrinogen-3 oxidase [Aliiroseovarius sediminilitoris]|uniref:Heme chaperone HemW n=1 Tax=Aliiroseovarius sediminilitoris TaxID=1173584 RepID=A0A1I0MSC3_9RHOB|nr:radical SAM family heme chaperone HemW [Aliiroseovarius sediminilitoris]SEV91532.1 oxygen-independent coproporphyrinogen-3 oxidase [Aliiroseovarius sediminilitoris]